MRSTIEIVQLLKQILNERTLYRVKLIKVFQNEVWNDENIKDSNLNEILSELAYDLDFYEPNEEWRMESTSYYDDEQLSEIVKSGIIKIEEYQKASQ